MKPSLSSRRSQKVATMLAGSAVLTWWWSAQWHVLMQPTHPTWEIGTMICTGSMINLHGCRAMPGDSAAPLSSVVNFMYMWTLVFEVIASQIWRKNLDLQIPNDDGHHDPNKAILDVLQLHGRAKAYLFHSMLTSDLATGLYTVCWVQSTRNNAGNQIWVKMGHHICTIKLIWTRHWNSKKPTTLPCSEGLISNAVEQDWLWCRRVHKQLKFGTTRP